MESRVFSSEVSEEGLGATLADSWVFRATILKCSCLPLRWNIVFPFQMCLHNNENNFLFKKQIHSGYNYTETIFVLFSERSGTETMASASGGGSLCSRSVCVPCLASTQRAQSAKRGQQACFCCVPNAVGTALFLCIFPREGKVQYSLFVGETTDVGKKSIHVRGGLRQAVLRIAWLIRAQRWSRVHVLWNGNPVLSGWAKIGGTQNCRQVLFYSFVSFQLISDLWMNKYTHESYRLCPICLQA